MLNNNTICAISTALSHGAISIVRMTGPSAFDIIKKVFKPKNEERFFKFESHTIHYGSIYDNDKILDDDLVSIMKGPKTYTGEDIVEINCHGGVFITKEVLEVILKNGAHLAEAGEFTKRAFYNGKLDLSQAEAVMDLLSAQSSASADISIKQLKGSLSSYINAMRGDILSILSTIEVNIDYPEYDAPELSIEEIKIKLTTLSEKINDILLTANTGKIIKEGIRTVLIGKPNVGKSSLLNRFLREDRAIVTDIPGTTRDTVEEYFNLDGIPLKLIDTAGIRDADNEVEKIGITKSKDLIKDADLVLALFDSSNNLEDEDIEILNMLPKTNVIGILNKTDLDSKIDTNKINEYIDSSNIISLSIKSDEDIKIIEDKIKSLFFNDKISVNNDLIITNTRHKDSLFKAKEYIDETIDACLAYVPQDLLSVKLQSALIELSNITGQNISEEIVNSIFHNFCVGK